MPITISFGENPARLLLGNSPAFDRELRELAALALLRNGANSTGQACESLGMDRAQFPRLMARRGIPALDISDADREEETDRVRARLSP